MAAPSRLRLAGWVAIPLTLLTLAWVLRPRPGPPAHANAVAAPAPRVVAPLAPLAEGAPAPRTDARVVTFVGDSLTAQGDWQAAFPGFRVHNQGVSGDTSFQLLVRLASIRQTRADTYLVMAGINDIVWGYEPGRIAARIAWLRTGLQLGSGARVIVQSTIPCARFRCGAEGVRRVAELNQQLRQRIPAGDFVDLSAALADADGLRLAYSLDGVHLNAAGYARWQARLRELGLP